MGFIILGVILIAVGIGLIFAQRHQQNRANCVRLARAVTVVELEKLAQEVAQEIGAGSWRDYVKLVGNVECDRPIRSELKQETCVHYEMSVRREYEETVTRQDEKGNTHTETQRGSETVASNQQSVPFTLRDRTGTISVDPTGAAIETVRVLDEFRHETGFSGGGMISFGGFSLALGNSGNRRTIGFRYSESILPLDRRVLVVGTVSDAYNGLTLQKPAEDKQLYIISLRTEEELAKAAKRNARSALWGAIACIVAGVVAIVFGVVTGG